MTNMMIPSNRRTSNFSGSGYKNRGKELGITTRINSLSFTDKELQEITRKMQESRRTLQKLDRIVKKTCKLPSNRARTIISKLFYGLMPKAILNYLPTAILEHLPPEEQNFLDTIAMLMRKNTNDTQEAALDIKNVMKMTEGMLNDLRVNFQKAKNENWDAKKLQACLANLAGIKINDEVQELLNQEYDFYLPEKEKKSEG